MISNTKAILLVAVTATLLGFSQNASADQPNMQNALKHLQAAKSALQAADTNKGGWRNSALASVNQAISETEKGIRFAR